jgi:hypothetical protein
MQTAVNAGAKRHAEKIQGKLERHGKHWHAEHHILTLTCLITVVVRLKNALGHGQDIPNA